MDRIERKAMMEKINESEQLWESIGNVQTITYIGNTILDKETVTKSRDFQVESDQGSFTIRVTYHLDTFVYEFEIL